MMTLSVEHFHSTTHPKNILMTQLQCAREFMKNVKEVLRRSHPQSSYYFTNTEGSWYPLTEGCTDYRELLLALPKKDASVYIDVSNESKLRTWVDDCIDYHKLLLVLPNKSWTRSLVVTDLRY